MEAQAEDNSGHTAISERERYIRAAMPQARYEVLPDDGSIFGEIPSFQGVYTNADARSGCEAELAEVLDGWLTLRLSWGRPIPVISA
ncbi:MAG: type II toxin-antitoxin system HicB family antitoxin [Chloroflexia bacterium]